MVWMNIASYAKNDIIVAPFEICIQTYQLNTFVPKWRWVCFIAYKIAWYTESFKTYLVEICILRNAV
jgi:hypothetical protein